MSILITGGAGYVGSHTAKLFSDVGLDVIVLDDLSAGVRNFARWGRFVEGDISDQQLVAHILCEYEVSTVIHLAARTDARESVKTPEDYFAINVSGTLGLLNSMLSARVLHFIFASSCAVYGESSSSAVTETNICAPVSPYGETKLMIERVLPSYHNAHGLLWTALRYFNVAGADDELGCGSSSRIIPRIARWATGLASPPEVFGTTFDSPDGSAVRDYIHVRDVAAANLCAFHSLEKGRSGGPMNIGSATGTSVLEIIDTISKTVGVDPLFASRPQSQGDPAMVVSNSSRAHGILGWKPQHSSPSEIVASVVRSIARQSNVYDLVPETR